MVASKKNTYLYLGKEKSSEGRTIRKTENKSKEAREEKKGKNCDHKKVISVGLFMYSCCLIKIIIARDGKKCCF